MVETTAPWGKGEKPTPETIEAAIRDRYPMLIDDTRPVITEEEGYDDGGGFRKDSATRGRDREDWNRDFVIDTLEYAQSNGCSRNAAIEAMHEVYLGRRHHASLETRKRVFLLYHREMRVHNFCLAVMNNDIKRAVHEALQSRTVRNDFLVAKRTAS